MTIQKITRAKDEYGTWTSSGTDISGLTDIPCRINWLTGQARGEKVIGDRITWTRDGKVYCDYSTGISVENRLVYDSKNYDIVGLSNPDEVGKYMVLFIKRSE